MKTKNMIISCILIAGLVISGLAFAGGRGSFGHRGAGFKGPHKSFALFLLVKYQEENLMIEALSEMTGQSVEAIQARLQGQRLRSVLQELGVDRQALHTAMRIKSIDLIQKNVDVGSITPEQAKEILQKMENFSKRRELMNQLVKKGVADGTITQEQAQLLLRKSRK